MALPKLSDVFRKHLRKKGINPNKWAEQMFLNHNSVRSWFAYNKWPPDVMPVVAAELGTTPEALTDTYQFKLNDRARRRATYKGMVRVDYQQDILPLLHLVVKANLPRVCLDDLVNLLIRQQQLGITFEQLTAELVKELVRLRVSQGTQQNTPPR